MRNLSSFILRTPSTHQGTNIICSVSRFCNVGCFHLHIRLQSCFSEMKYSTAPPARRCRRKSLHCRGVWRKGIELLRLLGCSLPGERRVWPRWLETSYAVEAEKLGSHANRTFLERQSLDIFAPSKMILWTGIPNKGHEPWLQSLLLHRACG